MGSRCEPLEVENNKREDLEDKGKEPRMCTLTKIIVNSKREGLHDSKSVITPNINARPIQIKFML